MGQLMWFRLGQLMWFRLRQLPWAMGQLMMGMIGQSGAMTTIGQVLLPVLRLVLPIWIQRFLAATATPQPMPTKRRRMTLTQNPMITQKPSKWRLVSVTLRGRSLGRGMMIQTYLIDSPVISSASQVCPYLFQRSHVGQMHEKCIEYTVMTKPGPVWPYLQLSR